ncbi:MAG: hypothetical protein A2144_08080 [Chloroflexi bacterium RBG_16_50_9]|nr:MAG: hypothetical protein A2144_08080 [Chloroflexi bacterium RBG_16_50_9]
MNKKVALLVLACVMAITLALSSCVGTDLREFADKYVAAEGKAWTQGNTGDLEKIEDPNVVIHNAGFEDTTGWEAHKKTILGARGMISGIQQEWKYLTGEGNHFAMAYKSQFTIPGKTPETSMKGTNDSIFLFRLNNGRVAEIWMNGSTKMVPVSTTK